MRRLMFLHELRAEMKLPSSPKGISDQALRKRLTLSGIVPRLEPCGRYMRSAITAAEASRVRKAFFDRHRKEAKP